MNKAQIFCVVGLGFGDEGKGSISEALASKYGAARCVRFNGGGQAAHHVHLPDGRSHCFSQFGSGTLQGAKTYYTSYCIFDPVAFLEEANALKKLGVDNTESLFYLAKGCKVATIFHKGYNRVCEISRQALRHGSCGMGIGAVEEQHLDRPDLTIYVRDWHDKAALTTKLGALYEYFSQKVAQLPVNWDKIESVVCRSVKPDNGYVLGDVNDTITSLTHAALRQCALFDWDPGILSNGVTVFEGAQGVLLDQNIGFHPHTTWSTTTTANVKKLIGDLPEKLFDLRVIGATRAFMTRHGAGPMPTAVAHKDWAQDEDNGPGTWQQEFRYGEPDLVLLKYAIDACANELPITELAVTCLDRLHKKPVNLCTEYGLPSNSTRISKLSLPRNLQEQTILGHAMKSAYATGWDSVSAEELPYVLQKKLGIPVVIGSYGKTANDKIFDEKDFRRW